VSSRRGLRATLAARLHRVTLRRRLIAILLALLLVSCAVVAVATALLLHAYLLTKLDQQLAAAGTRYSVALEHAGDGDVDDARFDSVLGQPSGTLGARILSGRITAIGLIGGGTEHPTPSPSDCHNSGSIG
jgi:two-component system OmpR family sensor kinase